MEIIPYVGIETIYNGGNQILYVTCNQQDAYF